MSDRSLARRRKKTTGKRWVAACAAAAVAIAIPALAAPAASAGGQDETHKVWVCKYVGKPGVDEQLKSGKQPISVDESATDGTGVGGYFNDAQGRSFVVAIDDGSGSPGSSSCPAPDGGPEVVEDASASVSTVPATCNSGEVLEYGGIENASFSGTADGAEGPGSYNVTATADAGHAFTGGDTTRKFSGSLDGPLTGADCAGPQPSDDTEYRDVEDAPDCSAGTVAIQHQERTRSYTLDGGTWVPGAWSEWTTVGTDARPATAEECPPPKPVKVDIPDMPATADPCNPAGVDNNVTWAGSLPASNAEVTWSEDPDTHVRTATLVGDAEWTDGSKDPKIYPLPTDDGRACDTPPPAGNVTATVSCSGIQIDGSNWIGGSRESGTAYGVAVYANGVLQNPNDGYTLSFGQGPSDIASFSGVVPSPDQMVDTVWLVQVTIVSYSQDYGPFSFGPWTQPACITPPVKVDIPASPGVNDPCNPVGVGNNVTWKDPLPADTDHVKWTEDSLARTASLVGNAEWADRTTVPKVYPLPGDSGELCVVVTTPVTTTPPATTPVTTPPPATTTPAATTNQPVVVNPPPADRGAQPAPAAPVPAAEAAPADAGSPEVAGNQPAVSMGAPPPPEAGDVAATPPVQSSTDTERVRALAILAVVILAMVAGCWLAPRPDGGRR